MFVWYVLCTREACDVSGANLRNGLNFNLEVYVPPSPTHTDVCWTSRTKDVLVSEINANMLSVAQSNLFQEKKEITKTTDQQIALKMHQKSICLRST